MVLLFVVCGWWEEAVVGVCLCAYLVHSTYVYLVTRATKDRKIVNPAVGCGINQRTIHMKSYSRNSKTNYYTKL